MANDSASYRIPILLRLPLYCSEVTVIFLWGDSYKQKLVGTEEYE